MHELRQKCAVRFGDVDENSGGTALPIGHVQAEFQGAEQLCLSDIQRCLKCCTVHSLRGVRCPLSPPLCSSHVGDKQKFENSGVPGWICKVGLLLNFGRMRFLKPPSHWKSNSGQPDEGTSP